MSRIIVIVCSISLLMTCKKEAQHLSNTNDRNNMKTGYEALLIDIDAEGVDENIAENVAQAKRYYTNIDLGSSSDFNTEWRSFLISGVGVIDIPEAGEYYFRLTSAGKVGLSLNNVDLVMHYDKHEKANRTGSRNLLKGPALFDFHYYPCEFEPVLILEWSRDGKEFEVIPDRFFKSATTVDVEPFEEDLDMEESQDPNTLTQKEIDEGWELLFDGKSTQGWHTYNNPGTIGFRWKAEDDALKFNGYDKYFIYKVAGKIFYHARIDKKQDGGVDIVSDKAFDNFILKLEWKISEYGNSGIFYTVQEIPEYDEGWKSSPEMQVLHDQGQKDGMIRSHRSGDLYDLIPCSERRTRGANEWNSVKIIKNKGKVEHWMNGKMVLNYDMNSDSWKEMIAKSKFAPYIENFGLAGPGKIGLQDHDDTVWYRNIKIKKL